MLNRPIRKLLKKYVRMSMRIHLLPHFLRVRHIDTPLRQLIFAAHKLRFTHAMVPIRIEWFESHPQLVVDAQVFEEVAEGAASDEVMRVSIVFLFHFDGGVVGADFDGFEAK